MKNTSLILLILVCTSCAQQNRRDQTEVIDPANTHPPTGFDWLSGSWIRSNDQDGNITYEHWVKNSGTEYTGLGCTLHNGDTVFKESLKLRKTEDHWNYEVSGVNESTTLFLLTELTESSFECINDYNDFPKKITYVFKDNILKVVISDDDREVIFLFMKMP